LLTHLDGGFPAGFSYFGGGLHHWRHIDVSFDSPSSGHPYIKGDLVYSNAEILGDGLGYWFV
jgi:hypothetical protein